jgi:hypothetical protein
MREHTKNTSVERARQKGGIQKGEGGGTTTLGRAISSLRTVARDKVSKSALQKRKARRGAARSRSKSIGEIDGGRERQGEGSRRQYVVNGLNGWWMVSLRARDGS